MAVVVYMQVCVYIFTYPVNIKSSPHSVYRVNINVTYIDISAEHAEFCMKFYTTVKQKMCTKFYLIYLKMTKLCCLNQNDPDVSALERHTELAALRTVSDSLKLSRFKPKTSTSGLPRLE